MDNEQYNSISDLERNGKVEEGFRLLERLAEEEHPMALLDLSARYWSIEGYAHPAFPLEPNHEISKKLAIRAKNILEKMVKENDGEAMRMLAYTYLGHWRPCLEKSIEQAEQLLLKAYGAGCYFAANDLSSFYVNSDLEQAKYWYQKADRHNCRVIYHEQCET
jgi:TPR repeat protein